MENLKPRTSKTIDAVGNVTKVYPTSIPVRGSGYTVKFKNPHQEGNLGDDLTAVRLKNDGYLELKSKTDKIHGIDGIYIKQVGKNTKEIRVIENKVGGGQLCEDRMGRIQMSGPWLNARIKDMIGSSDSELQKTGKLLKKHRSLIRPELWRYDLRNPTKSRFSVLDSNARVRHETTEHLPAEFIAESIKRMCKSKSLDCMPSR